MALTPAFGQIVAMGGGGFSMEPDNPLLDDFVLSLSRRHPARVCFIPTASADSAGYGDERRRAFHRAIADGAGAGYAAEDGAALHFTGPSLAEVVSSRADAAAYRVEQAAGRVVETRLPVRFLGQTLSAGS